jgi:N4-gp56 family major capsid protein
MAIFTSSSNTSNTERALIVGIVQDQLQKEAKLPPTVSDISNLVQPGAVTVALPKWTSGFSGPAAQNVDGDTVVAFQTATFGKDTLTLDQWVNLPYALTDRIKMQSAINLESELAQSAGREMAIWVDNKIITELRLASASSPDHVKQMTGTSNLVLTLADIVNMRMLLNKQNLPESDRTLLIAPEQEAALLKMDNFIRADAYGARDGLLNGEIGRVFGFRVIVHNGLDADEAIAYHKSAVAFAAQKQINYEKQRGAVNLQRDEYSFSCGMGFEVLQGGKCQVLYTSDSEA